MKLIRLRIQDFRGVRESEIRLPDGGVTIIEGPNEAGKSSHMEAIDLLLSEYDSTTKRTVKDIQPVDRDAGPRVELEAQSGKYHFTYRKRFLKNPGTELTVHAPRPENLTGRDAHHRVEEILGETIDLELWRALRIIQGKATEQADLSRKVSLVEALNEATGSGRVVGEDELNLFDAVEEEYAVHWTKDGKEKEHLRSLRNDVEDARKRVQEIEDRIAGVEADVRSLEALHQEGAELARSIIELTDRFGELEKRSNAADALEHKVADERRRLADLEKVLESTQTAMMKRERLRLDLENAQKVLEALEQDFEAREASEGKQQEREQSLRAEVQKVEDAVRTMTSELKVRGADVAFRRSELNQELLGDRLRKAEDASGRLRNAEDILLHRRLDDADLRDIESKHLAVQAARGRFEEEAARIRIKAAKNVQLDGPDGPVSLASDESQDWNVTDELHFQIPGLMSIKVAPGSSTQELQDRVERTSTDLIAALQVHGVQDLDEARAAHHETKTALEHRDRWKRDLVEALRDLTMDDLKKKVEQETLHAALYPKTRSSDIPLPGSLDEAKRVRDEAALHLEARTRERDHLRAQLDEVHEARTRQRDAFHGKKAEVNLQREAVTRLSRELEAEEKTVSVATLKERVKEAEAVCAKQNDAVRLLCQQLDELDPATLNTLIANAKRSLDSSDERQRRVRDEMKTIEGRLEARGQEGLADAFAEAERAHQEVERKLRGSERKAAAAFRLYNLFETRRREAVRGYVTPLEDKIRELGRLVFGPSFSVRVGEDLNIEERTLNGTTIPYDSLSGGVKEQLVIIHRLACASIVSQSEGVPVILDDTLGQTDPLRLEGMGAAIAKVGEECQVILLTSTPSRFRHVGGAHSIYLANASQRGSKPDGSDPNIPE